MLSHLIPLLALHSRLEPGRHDTAFLVPKQFHDALADCGRNALAIDHQLAQAFRTEMLAYSHFKPDVVIDDLAETVIMSTKIAEIPRITIRRTGTFPGCAPRNLNHRHSLLLPGSDSRYFAEFYRNSEAICGLPPPKTLADACDADVSVVPGIRAIERLPPNLAADPSYVFSGPLIVPDSEAARISQAGRDTEALLSFIDGNQSRPIAFLTLGNILAACDPLPGIVKHILEEGFAVISNVNVSDVAPNLRDRFFHRRFLPMDAVCSRADVMIHHCGSGTYQYQLMHALPSIAVGSQCYDRDDVAMRLDELGVAKYVCSPDDAPDFSGRLLRAFDECSNKSGTWFKKAQETLRALKEETARVANLFDLESVLEMALPG